MMLRSIDNYEDLERRDGSKTLPESRASEISDPSPHFNFKFTNDVSGPDPLQDPKHSALLTPFELEWAFGFNITVPLINLTDGNRHQVVYTANHIGVLYNYCTKESVHLKGHRHQIVSVATDAQGRWLVTADNGEEDVVLIWDLKTQELLWTIFNSEQGREMYLVALSPSGKLLVTITSQDKVKVEFWLWTFGGDKPNDAYIMSHHVGRPQAVEFHPNNEAHIMVVFEHQVVFFVWDFEKSKVLKSLELKGTKAGAYTDCTYVEQCHECFASTSKGHVLVFGNTIYAKNYVHEELDNMRMLIKNVKVSKVSITCIASMEEIIVVGDEAGDVTFFDKRLKLLYWLTKNSLSSPICHISFQINPRQYLLVDLPDFQVGLVKSDPRRISDCEDRSDEYQVLIQQAVPKDAQLERNLFLLRDFFVTKGNGTIYLVDVMRKHFIPLFPSSESPIAAIDVHDELPHVIIAYRTGRLIVFNYETHQEVSSTIIPDCEESVITTIKFSPRSLHLAVGKLNGELYFLHPALLSQIYAKPVRVSARAVMKDENNTVFGFYYDVEKMNWIFKGKVRSHYKAISNIFFFDFEPAGLYTIGEDRHIIKYSDLAPNEEELDISTRERVEQRDVPVYCIPFPKGKYSLAGSFLVADDKHKYKILNAQTMMTTAVFLGPAYGCFKHMPVLKMEYLPQSDYKYMIFMTNKQIGIQLMPMDGNPYKFVGCLAHPDQLLDFKCSFDGRFVFTIGKNDRIMMMWKTNTVSVDLLHQMGGVELQPFYCLLEGGRDGFIFQEIRELFYYLQILQQGEQVSAPTNVRNFIHVNEIPGLLRSCGFYPSEYEIETILTDLRYQLFDDHGVIKEKVTFCDFVKIFINHKPVYGYNIEQLEQDFQIITGFNDSYESGEMSSADFIEALNSKGEQMRTDKIFKCLATLLNVGFTSKEFEERYFGFMPSTIDFETFAEDILGIDIASIERQSDVGEDNQTTDADCNY